MHCHHKSLFKDHAEAELIRQIGLDAEVLDSGCCGMAGSFGYEERHYEISMKVGERVLLPRVRQASRDTLIIANGFSCREQIAQGTPRRAMHIAEVLQMALHRPTQIPSKGYSEIGYVQPVPSNGALKTAVAIGAAGLLFAGGQWAYRKVAKR